ncbi:MAG: hypothetical protein HY961_01070 [Ignavibacteriae bacterium]|nr:hypothetical protein [Ignavibacteriota bacterium]
MRTTGLRARSVGLILIVTATFLCTREMNAEEKRFALVLKGSLTTGSQLFPKPTSASEIERAQFFSMKDILGYGAELRYRFPESNLAVGISADYIRATEARSFRVSGVEIPIDDGYRVIPIELTGYFLIPISGETFGVYIGGGAGMYLGRRIYRVADVEAPSTDQGRGFGIHVLSGLSYRFTEMFSLTAELKFRDLQFNSVNHFSSTQIRYRSTVINLSDPGESRVHTDGMIIQLGAVIEF